MVTLSFADLLVMLSCLGAVGGVIFAAGRLSARVDSLEEWRLQQGERDDRIYGALRELRAALTHGEA